MYICVYMQLGATIYQQCGDDANRGNRKKFQTRFSVRAREKEVYSNDESAVDRFAIPIVPSASRINNNVVYASRTFQHFIRFGEIVYCAAARHLLLQQ